ncbi:cytochrome P450 [Suillus paluster]|uniref:cytochrome P450 n=1 Tax=Suillus paluster TaxID=48578 RepID=UPI001B86B45F|nr:cytochrome P450 [Suillus paluster]KAG1736938.1 cytochrome P450 [Suillus paluster]
MARSPNLDLSVNMWQLVLRAAACLGIIGSGLPLPPSPPARRLRGHFLPRRKLFLLIEEWIDEYGPLITIRSGLENVVVIGRYKAAVDIMENQGKSLADRPRTAGEFLGDGMGIPFVPKFGEKFRRMRRALHTHLQPKAAEAYQPMQMSHAKNTVLDILDDPSNFENHLTTYDATTTMKVAYGKTTPTLATDPEVIEMSQLIRTTGAVIRTSAYLVNTIPWLKYLPWYSRDLKQGFERRKNIYMGHLNRVKEQMQSNVNIYPSFAKYMLESSDIFGFTEAEIASLTGAFFGTGPNTSAVALCTVLMAAACFPEEQAIVQDRARCAPTFADQESLPRLHAFISEALRWRPLASNGLAHLATKDVIWDNYCIPAGTTVVGNHWAISRDPEVYPEPYAFKPQRWIDEQGLLRDDLKFFVYGFGRRACPGQHIANRSVFINSALILWAFQLALDPTKPLDDMGFMSGPRQQQPCTIEFETRIPETELKGMMQNYPEVA